MSDIFARFLQWLFSIGRSRVLCPRRSEVPRAFELAGASDFWRKDDTCSFCGSLKPRVFLDRVRTGAQVTPSDKDYKAYVEGPGVGKVYFQHFDAPEQRELIQLVNEGVVHFRHPGRFYVLPFFMRRTP